MHYRNNLKNEIWERRRGREDERKEGEEKGRDDGEEDMGENIRYSFSKNRNEIKNSPTNFNNYRINKSKISVVLS